MDEHLLPIAARRDLSQVVDTPVRRRLLQSINLLDNYTRGRVAEVIVAVCSDGELVGEGYGSWDVQLGDTRIEVKASGLIQSWPQKKVSAATFSISRAAGWVEQDDGSFVEDPTRIRRSDAYVFAHHLGGKPDNFDEWAFYVVPTARIDEICGDQATITLSAIKKRLDPRLADSESLGRTIVETAPQI